jgi:hypothetical protein
MAASHEGFLYEQNAYRTLKPYGIAAGAPPAGASHDRPDLEIKLGKKTSGVELKNQPTTAGSLVMQYYGGEWHFGPTDNNPEKEFMKGIGMSVKILDTMNDKWKKPVLQYENGQKTYVGAKDQRQAYQLDIAKFGGQGAGDIYVPVPNAKISGYYNKKDTYYLNVGTHGFFLFGRLDPLEVNKRLTKAKLEMVPDFSHPRSATTKIRVRCQYKSPGYQFSFTLQFGNVMKSPYNLAPLRSGSNSAIDLAKLKRDAILGIFG